MTATIYFKTVADSYNDYKAFCLDAGHKPLGRCNFSKRMEALGFEKKKVEKGFVLGKTYPHTKDSETF